MYPKLSQEDVYKRQLLYMRYYSTLRKRIIWKDIIQKQSMYRFFQVNRDIFFRTLCPVSYTHLSYQWDKLYKQLSADSLFQTAGSCRIHDGSCRLPDIRTWRTWQFVGVWALSLIYIFGTRYMVLCRTLIPLATWIWTPATCFSISPISWIRLSSTRHWRG